MVYVIQDGTSSVIYIYKRMYVDYALVLEPAASTVFMVWLRAWLHVRVMRFGGGVRW